MEDVLYYLLKVSIGIAVFYITYHFLFRKSKQFVFNRFYLLGSFLVSFIIPLIPIKTTSYVNQASSYFFNNVKDTGDVKPVIYATDSYKSLGFPEILLIIYLVGVIYYLVKLVYGYRIAARLGNRCTKKIINGMNVYISEENIRAFTFLDQIIIGKTILNHPSLALILHHEAVHSREKHFYDIIISELLFILQWFNPFARLHHRAIKNNLEFRADDWVIRESDIQEYLLTMLSMVHKRVKPPLFAELHSSNLKKRIIMMKSKSKNRFGNLPRLALIPVLAILLAFLSGKETVAVNDDRDKNDKGHHVATQAFVMEADSQDELKSVDDMLSYIRNNMKYPAEARKSGHVGTVELFARINQNGAIKEVLKVQPEEGFATSESIVIVGYTDVKPELSASSSHSSLIAEGRRVIESFPVLKIPELYGQTVRFEFKFEIR